jgi:GT2 family glycosyltransferase
MSKLLDLTITIVSWNTEKLTRDCLNSLLTENVKRIAEVHVVDNNSQDGSVEMIRREFPEVKLFANTENLGFAGANNQSWHEARGRYWLLLNSDTIVKPRAIENLVAFMDSHPRAGLATGNLRNPDGTTQVCAAREQGILTTLLEFSRLHKLLSARKQGELLLGKYFSHDRPQKLGWAWGTALIARREAVEQSGALSEEFFMYGEDLEWSLRIRKHGWEVWFCPEAEIIHFGGQSSDQVWDYTEKNTIILNNCYRAMEKHRGRFYVKVLQIITLLVSSVELFLSKISHREGMSKYYRSLTKYHFEKLKGDNTQATVR